MRSYVPTNQASAASFEEFKAIDSPIGKEFFHDVIAGLSSSPQKTIPGKYLWDETGSSLFDDICSSETYYPTSRERNLLSYAVDDLTKIVGKRLCLAEIGSGASHKIRILLNALEKPRRYVAVDISQDFMSAAAERIRRDYPGLEVMHVCADYSLPLPPLPIDHEAGVLGLFLGTSIGNVDRENAKRLLTRVREALQPSWLLIGQDPNSDLAIMNRAYNGPLMSAFHKNVLVRMVRELGAQLTPDHFVHEARFFDAPLRTEAHIVATRTTSIVIAGHRFQLDAGESIRTDVSWKYNKADFLSLLAEAGWCPFKSWMDQDGLYGLHLASSQL